jgi:hypothetical protein
LANFKSRLKALEEKVAKENLILTEAQLTALEKKKQDDEAWGEIETAQVTWDPKIPFMLARLKAWVVCISKRLWIRIAKLRLRNYMPQRHLLQVLTD